MPLADEVSYTKGQCERATPSRDFSLQLSTVAPHSRINTEGLYLEKFRLASVYATQNGHRAVVPQESTEECIQFGAHRATAKPPDTHAQ